MHRRSRRPVVVAAGAIVLILAALIAARVLTSGGGTAVAPEGPVPPELMGQLTSVPPTTFEQVGRGGVQALPSPVRAALQRGPSGLPLVTYIGAEYCPFCAAERWPLIIALSRFGTFDGLRLTHSASDDVYPSTATLSFYGSSYSSRYLEFSAVETQTNVRSGNRYTDLQTPTPAQQNVLRTYDVPPYVGQAGSGGIPFLDIADQYVLGGATYDVGLLRGLSQAQIAGMLADGTTDQARAIIGSANVVTAALCLATDNSPPGVCGQTAVKSLRDALSALPTPRPRP